jgi:DMSO/TMAO reductase YedYZ molybdopterin-dependent catalytic subunit
MSPPVCVFSSPGACNVTTNSRQFFIAGQQHDAEAARNPHAVTETLENFIQGRVIEPLLLDVEDVQDYAQGQNHPVDSRDVSK